MNTLRIGIWLLSLAAFGAWGEGRLIGRALYQVGDTFITTADLDRSKTYLKIQYQLNGLPLPADEELDHQALGSLISIRSQFEALGNPDISLSDSEIIALLTSIASERHLTLPAFQAELNALYPKGFEIYREAVRTQYLLSRLQRGMVRPDVSDNEVNAALLSAQDNESYDVLYLLNYDSKNPVSQKAAEALFEAHKDDKTFEGLEGKGYRLIRYQDRARADLPQAILEHLPQHPLEISAFQNENGQQYVFLLQKGGEKKVMLYHLARILLRREPALDKPAALSRLSRIKRQFEEGVPFGVLTKLYSEDYETNLSGGDLGWLPLEALDEEGSQLVEKLSKGTLSDPYETQEGYQITLVLDREEREETLETQRDRLKTLLSHQRAGILLSRWIDKTQAETSALKLEPLALNKP